MRVKKEVVPVNQTDGLAREDELIVVAPVHKKLSINQITDLHQGTRVPVLDPVSCLHRWQQLNDLVCAEEDQVQRGRFYGSSTSEPDISHAIIAEERPRRKIMQRRAHGSVVV